ncbi:hypothetical protein BDQ17DRAFT_1430664 [Cyathus striatus]|nr:hypothetical protein BDQ17DRAFT_1430664 [Cyathus striatus]
MRCYLVVEGRVTGAEALIPSPILGSWKLEEVRRITANISNLYGCRAAPAAWATAPTLGEG